MGNPMLMRLNQQQMQNKSSMNPLEQFQQFKKQLNGTDPKAMVENLLRSGRMTQAQFQQLSQQARELEKMLK